MRLIPVLMLAFLMLGFAARPTVSAALTNGSVLMHALAATAIVVDQVTMEEASVGEDVTTFAKCVSLGTLPAAQLCVARQRDRSVEVVTSAIRSAKPLYWILRPPISSVQAKQLDS